MATVRTTALAVSLIAATAISADSAYAFSGTARPTPFRLGSGIVVTSVIDVAAR